MSDRLTAAGAALLDEVHGTTMALTVFPARIRAIEAEAAARAVDEAPIAEWFHERDAYDCRHANQYRWECRQQAAALVAHLRGPR
jgi:hypothetical protein